MPNYFQRLNARTNRVFGRATHGADRFFSRVGGEIRRDANAVGHGITKVANKVGNGIERAVKSEAFRDVLGVGSIIAAPFSGGTSLALAGSAAGLQMADHARKAGGNIRREVNQIGASGKQAYRNAVSQVNTHAQRGIQKAALSTKSGLMSLADRVPVAASQMGNTGGQQLAGDDMSQMTLH